MKRRRHLPDLVTISLPADVYVAVRDRAAAEGHTVEVFCARIVTGAVRPKATIPPRRRAAILAAAFGYR